jgi:hypothetical protein
MSQESKEFATKLAADHTAFIAGLINSTGLNVLPVQTALFLYETAMVHAFGHGVEWADNQKSAGHVCGCVAKESPFDLVAKGKLPAAFGPFVPHTEATTPDPLDLRLPSIVLECTAAKAWCKFEEEVAEYGVANGLHALIELWDAQQALQTYRERGGKVGGDYNVGATLARFHDAGEPVMEAKRAMLIKNATKSREDGGTGYYSEDVNESIILGTWRP